MWSPHASVGLCQTVFYTPIILAAATLILKRRHENPLWQWRTLLLFSVVRFVGGILLIEFVKHRSSVGWITVGYVFQGAGVLPLLVSMMLHLVLIRKIDFGQSKAFQVSIMATRLLILASIATIIAGSVLQSKYQDENEVKLGLKLSKAGYVIVIFVIVSFYAYIWRLLTLQSRLGRNSKKVMLAIAIACPFLLVRASYSILSVYQHSNIKWNPLFGSIAPLVVMHSIMEYIVVLILLITGYLLDPLRFENYKEDAQSRHPEVGYQA